MMNYPEDIVRKVIDPCHGLPGKSQFLPTVFEIRTALDAAMRPILEAERRRRLAEINEADRPSEVTQEGAARRKAVVERWRREMATCQAASVETRTPLADMDARGLHGEHRAVVLGAIEEKIATLCAASRQTPILLSSEALKTRICRMGAAPRASGAAGEGAV